MDVGACDPVVDSISWAFYEQGWCGALIEPVPTLAAALRQRRPEDITIEAAAGAKNGSASIFVSEPVGNSTLARDVAERLAAAGSEFSEIDARVATLDDLLDEARFDGRTIHFCTIDVEGSEADVLAGFDLARWRPWVLVIEATEPNTRRVSYEQWESWVLAAGYRFCLFDGLNRFYVHPDKAGDFAEQLSYPACVFDAAFTRAVTAARRSEELERVASEAARRSDELELVLSQTMSRVSELEQVASRLPVIERQNDELITRADEAVAELDAMRATISWRVTRPLRTARAMHRSVARPNAGKPHRLKDRISARIDPDLELAFARRLVQATEALYPDSRAPSPSNVETALIAFEEALTSSDAPDRAKAWLSLVTVNGCFPGEIAVERMARLLRMEGAAGLRNELIHSFAESLEAGLATFRGLDVRCNRIIVDVTHTAMASDLHTGIQRVVRETVTRWIDADRPMDLVRFDLQPSAARRLSNEECGLFKGWREYLGSAPRPYPVSAAATANALVPWQCDLIVPELPFEKDRTAAYRGIETAEVLRSLSMVGYDVIPIVAAEKVVTQATADFCRYLSVIKRADRISTISRTSKDSFKAFATMAAAEGVRTPKIETHELPAVTPQFDRQRLEAARSELGVGAAPLILAVGSHEPRKNHLIVLEAAERLWARDDRAFELVFLGWGGWLAEEFDDLVNKLVSAGRRIIVRKRCSEEVLWTAYRLARFTVFPSLLEGYGLPIAESLASGTPVITSNYGSMAEVAEKGGCLLVDPRDVDELTRAMALLLDDDEALVSLRDEALGVDTGTWEVYASQLWDFFTTAAVEEKLKIAP